MIATLHPSLSRVCCALTSRSTFFANFGSQKSSLLLGVYAYLQPGCLCQKQPWTNRHNRCLENTKSGFPGRSFLCRRYRSPISWHTDRTTNSGCVFLPLIIDMIFERCAGETMSALNTFVLAGPLIGFLGWRHSILAFSLPKLVHSTSPR